MKIEFYIYEIEILNMISNIYIDFRSWKKSKVKSKVLYILIRTRSKLNVKNKSSKHFYRYFEEDFFPGTKKNNQTSMFIGFWRRIFFRKY